MPTLGEGTPKRKRGRPPGSGRKANHVNKVVKDHGTARRTLRSTAARRGQAVEVPATQDEDNHGPSASDAASTADGAWEIAYHSLQDENEELRNRCSELEEALSQSQFVLSQTQKQSTMQVEKANNAINAGESRIEELQEALNASEEKCERLSMKQADLRQRATEAKRRADELQEKMEIMKSGQPGHSAPASSSTRARSPVSTEPLSSDEDGPLAPRPSQQAFGRTGRARSKTPWPEADARALIAYIERWGPKWSKIAKNWRTVFPGRHPWDQHQMKDKARVLKKNRLKNDELLPVNFDQVGLTKNCRKEIQEAGRNPDRREADVRHGRPVKIFLCDADQVQDEGFDT